MKINLGVFNVKNNPKHMRNDIRYIDTGRETAILLRCAQGFPIPEQQQQIEIPVRKGRRSTGMMNQAVELASE